MYKTRYLEKTIIKLSKTFPIVLLTGARQVGKTTMLQYISENAKGMQHRYVSLDEFETRSLAKSDPRLFLEQYPHPLMIDEIQYAPRLLHYIKAEADRRKKMGMYWLTGSQQFHLMKNISESLAGRVGILKLLGVSYAEEKEIDCSDKPWSPDRLLNKEYDKIEVTVHEIFKKIVRGSFPRLLHRNAPPHDVFYGSYVQTYIDRDLRNLIKVASLSSFEKFIRICAARTASMVNFSDLARDSGVSVNTVKEWVSLLEASHHIFLLQPYYTNQSRRLIKTPKLYFLDTGLVAYLTGWRDPITASRGAFAGAFFETFVISEIIKSYWHRGLEPRIFYFRTKEKVEVDLLIEKDGALLPVEIKLSSMVKSDDIKGIRHLKKQGLPVGAGAVVAFPREPYLFEKGISVVPPSLIR